MTCLDFHGARAIPDDVIGGYAPCPPCVVDAGTMFVVLEYDEADSH